ncbi:MAG: glycosyltransferase family 2 protein [bacterium]|nr:glycosyltransferase family 2 protein [bacterium]
MNSEVFISVVVPLLNEAESLQELYERLSQNLNKLGEWEIIFIDDGSRDDSLKILTVLHQRDPRVRVLSFRKNYGKSAALNAGFHIVKGRFIVTLDADLQDDPDEIPHLIKKLEEGYDLVSGWKKKRHDPISKTFPSKIFNLTTSLLTGLRLHDFNCGLKAYRSEVVSRLPVYGEMHRFLPALAHWDGFKVTEIPVKHHPRKFGYSKFGATRFLNGFLDLLTVLFLVRYTKKPMHLFGLAGALFTTLGIIILGYLTWGWLHGVWIGNRPIFFLGILLVVFGAQSFSVGLIGELLTRLHSDRREYSFKALLGIDQEQL